MKKSLMTAALAATALTATNASAATLVDFTIDTALDGAGVPGAPTTALITGEFDYDAIFVGGPATVNDFSVLIEGTAYSAFPGGVIATLSNFTGGGDDTATLNFSNGGTTMFSFDLSDLSSDEYRPPVFGDTVTNETTFNYGETFVNVEAGSEGTLSIVEVAAPVPEPATWAMMLIGFFAAGGAMRATRRNQKATVSYA